MEALVLYATWPDAASAEECAASLLEERLAACVVVQPGARSFYRWEGEVRQDEEALMLIKTTADLAPAARDHVLAAHPYDLPCVLALPVEPDASHGDYLRWIGAETA